MTGQALENALNVARLSEAGLTANQIAAELGICVPYVKILAKSQSTCFAKPLPRKDRVVEQARALAAQGLTRSEIAGEIGIAYPYFCRMTHGEGIKFRRVYNGAQYGPDQRSMQMAALYKSGRTLAEIGSEFGITRERVRQILTKHHNIRQKDGGQCRRAADKRAAFEAKRNATALKKWGCTWDEYVALRDLKKPTRAYASQKRNAARRSIEWQFNLWQWWQVWQQSGRWESRGRGQGYMMCRKGDTGPYAVDNVFIATGIENSSSGPHKKSGLPTGVSVKRGIYIAHRSIKGKKTYLGSFKTPLLAHAAYLNSFNVEAA